MVKIKEIPAVSGLEAVPQRRQLVAAGYLRVPEAAQRLDVHVNTVRRWLRNGTLQGGMPGGDKSGYRIPIAAIDELLAQQNGTRQRHPRRKQDAA